MKYSTNQGGIYNIITVHVKESPPKDKKAKDFKLHFNMYNRPVFSSKEIAT